jgi:hypothetical protein
LEVFFRFNVLFADSLPNAGSRIDVCGLVTFQVGIHALPQVAGQRRRALRGVIKHEDALLEVAVDLIGSEHRAIGERLETLG